MPSNSAQLRLHDLGFQLDGTKELQEAWDNLWKKHHDGKPVSHESVDELWELIWRYRH